MKFKSIGLGACLLFCLNIFGCSNENEATESKVFQTPNYTLPSGKSIYIPSDLRTNDFTQKDSQWSYYRMAYSTNFVVFWEKGFGTTPSTTTEKNMQVDIQDLLKKAELFYDINVNKLKFVIPGQSNTDKYRMMIFLKYQTEWLATGAGYDDIIGALWVNPSTCQPVGSVIAHEVGHCFQYQVYCDNKTGDPGYRYGFGNNGEGGNGFWEQCAQWQAYKVYTEEQFTNYNFTEYLASFHKHLLHETPRYANYFIQDYWCMKHGLDFMGKLWRQAKKPEDPIETYQRITNISQKAFNDEIFDAARRFVNWDIDAIRSYGKNYTGRTQCKLVATDNGYFAIDPVQCIENYGYNVITLNTPSEASAVTADFKGIAGTAGYRSKNVDRAGWRYGFVAYLNDGNCIYSDIFDNNEGKATFNCPANTKNLYFVVSGAPTTHWRHAWDDDDTNDEQWPYKVKFGGTNVYGQVAIDPSATPQDIMFTYNVAFPASATEYSGTTIEVDANKLCNALVLTKEELSAAFGKTLIFNGVNTDGTLSSQSTASEPGHWFDAKGNICSWGDSAELFSEFNLSTLSFKLGQYPGHCSKGDKYNMKQILLYTPAMGTSIKATFLFNITIQ